MATYLDWTHLERHVDIELRDGLGQSRGEAFAFTVLQALFGLSGDDCREAITDGAQDRGVDAVYIDTKGDHPIINFLQFKYHSDFQSANRNFPGKEIDKILTFVSDLLSRAPSLSKKSNVLLRSKVKDIYASIDADEPRFVVHLCSNGKPLQTNERERLDGALLPHRTFSVLEHGLDELSNALTLAARSKVNAQIKLSGRQYFEKSDGNIRGIVGTITVSEFAKLIADRADQKRINNSIFVDNFRVFLGFQNDINDAVFKSAISDSNYQFWYLNNGITLTCDRFGYQVNLDSPIVKLENAQIVNGLQTSHALFEAYHREMDKVKDVSVLIRIYETCDNSVSHRIAEATNSQSRINTRNLKANHRTQIQIQQIMKSVGYFYETKPGQFAGSDLSRRVDSLKFGQVILAYFNEMPDRAKAHSDKIFDEYYEDVFGMGLDCEKTLNAYKAYLRIEQRGHEISEKVRKIGKHKFSFITYGQFHILYGVRLIQIASSQPIGSEISDDQIDASMHLVEQIVEKLKGWSYYEIFRNSKTTRLMQRMSESEQGDLFAELDFLDKRSRHKEAQKRLDI